MARYEGKRAVVIGGTSGMGLATARLLRDDGVSVLVTGRTEEGVETARRQLGDQVEVVVSDTTSVVDIAALGEHVEERLGRVDAVFVSAGISRQRRGDLGGHLRRGLRRQRERPVLHPPAIGAAHGRG